MFRGVVFGRHQFLEVGVLPMGWVALVRPQAVFFLLFPPPVGQPRECCLVPSMFVGNANMVLELLLAWVPGEDVFLCLHALWKRCVCVRLLLGSSLFVVGVPQRLLIFGGDG